MSEQNILEVRNLTKHFKAGGRQVVHAECRSSKWYVRALNSVLNLFAPLM